MPVSFNFIAAFTICSDIVILFNITVIQVYAPASNAEEAEVEWFYEGLQDFLALTPWKDVLFIIGGWNAKVGSQEIPVVTGKYGPGVQNEAGQRLTEFCQENALVIANTLFNNTREDSTHGHHQMVNTKIRLIIFFAAKDGEALYSQQKQDRELTVNSWLNELLIAQFNTEIEETTSPSDMT